MHARGKYESGTEKEHVKAVLNKNEMSALVQKDLGTRVRKRRPDVKIIDVHPYKYDDKNVGQFSEAKGKKWED